jgi:DNA-binding NarL/FixJ family response regulator
LYLAAVRAQLDEATFNAMWNEGRAMTMEQAIEFALAEIKIPDAPARSLTPRQAAKEKFGGLTAREREVSALIAQGKSNREIAEVLVLSERTIEGHVANILNKLGFNARSQIAAWVVQKGLEKG